MQINKKLLTIAVTALLLISMLAAAVPAFAAPTATLYDQATPTPNVITTAQVGDVVTVSGTGASPGGLIELYWDNLAGSALSSAYALGSNAYEVKFTVPAAVAGAHYVLVKDGPSTTAAPLTILPKITLSASRGLPNDVITVTGTGFMANGNITVAFSGNAITTPIDVTAAKTTSSTSGGFTATFAVPSGTAYSSTAYTVGAADNATTPNVATASFTVGASITITPTSGPAGTIVTITGRGFTHSTTGTLLAITIGGVTPKNLTTMRTAADGTFTGQFVVPSSLAVSSTRYVVSATDAVDTGVTSGTGSFKVTGATQITTASSGAPGATVTLTGKNFTAIAGTVVKVDFGILDDYATFTTDANGAFSGSMTIPYITVGTYTVTATDANGLTDDLTFKVAITSASVTPSTAPVGTVVTVSGYGFTAGDDFNVTFAGILVAVGTVASGTPSTITATFTIPAINPNTYSVIVTDESGLTATAELTVNATSTLTLNPATAPKNIAVTITATNFGAASTLSFYLTNSTASWGGSGLNGVALTVSPVTGFTGTTTNATGAYKGTFIVTASDIALGAYTIVANNTNSPANTFNATVSFTLGSATLDVSTRATSYRQGDIVSFKITSSYAADLIITIVDPEGVPAIIPIDETFFVQIGSTYVLSYAKEANQAYYGDQWATFTIPSDAPTGTWCWNTTAVEGLKRTGEFTVIKSISGAITDINTKLDGLNATLLSVKDNVLTIKTATTTIQTTLDAINAKLVSIEGKVATIDTNVGQIKVSIADLPASVSSSVQTAITNGMATITTSIGTITTKLSSLETTISTISGDVVTLKTSIGAITTTINAINTQVISIEGNVATIKTDVGTLSGVVTEIKDGIATINTGVGTITTSVANLQPEVTQANDNTSSMSTMIYVAVAFAIIAAIAAVASILLMRKKIAS